ncbi:MAG: hypothetical protein ABEJ34_05535 [Haloferacaceae archaeon]
MTDLSVGGAVRDGAARFLSRTGALLLALYLPAMVLYQLSFNGLLDALLGSRLPGEASVGVTYPAPTAVHAAVVLVTLVGMSAFTVVAVRTFVAGATDDIPREFYTRRLPWTTANVIVGGLAFGLLVVIGSLLLVIPGIVAYVGLVFTTMFIAAEDEHFVAAFRRSWGLVRPAFLSVFALLLVLVVGVGLAAGIVGAVLSVGAAAVGLETWSNVVSTAVTVPLSLFVLAVLAAAFDRLRGTRTRFV